MSTVLSFENGFVLHGLVPTYHVCADLPGLRKGDVIIPLVASAMRETQRGMNEDLGSVSDAALSAISEATGASTASIMASVCLVRFNLIIFGRDRMRRCGKTVGIVRGPSVYEPDAVLVPITPEHIRD